MTSISFHYSFFGEIAKNSLIELLTFCAVEVKILANLGLMKGGLNCIRGTFL
jgi:hypothetical protein